MTDFVILTDSCCDLSQAMIDKLQVKYAPLSVHMDDETRKNYLDEREITYKEFYGRVPQIKNLKTSAVNQHDFLELMEPIAAEGKDFIYIGFSSGLSGTYSASLLAVEELKEKYPERKMYAVDTLAASLGQGMLVYYACLEKAKGRNIDEVYRYLEDNKLHLRHCFTVNDLMHLKRGGRVSTTTALVGSMLSIKPVLHVDNEGHLTVAEKSRGRKNSIKRLLDEMRNTAINPEDQVIFISHGDCEEDAQYLAGLIRDELHVKDVVINYVGPVIGAHAGPGTLALFFFGSKR